MAELIRVEGLKTYFPVYKALVQAVDGVSFHVDHGEMVGLVGESGSGKSVTGMSILGIVERPGRIEGLCVLSFGRAQRPAPTLPAPHQQT